MNNSPSFTVAAAIEPGRRGITVNTVSPGVKTLALSEIKAWMARASPLGHLGKPADIADVAAFLISAEARWVTAQDIRATGGTACS